MSKNTDTNTVSARVAALEALIDVVENKRSLNTCLDAVQGKVKPADRALVQELAFGTCRWYFALLSLVRPLLHKPIKKKDRRAWIVLALGAYQLYFTRIPAHAALNETIAAAEKIGLKPIKGLINAVLRELSRLEAPDPNQLYATSHPDWIQAKLSHNWPEYHDDIFRANNERPPMTLRINKRFTTRSKYLDALDEAKIESSPTHYSESGISLAKACDVKELPNFDDGFVSVQDEAAQLCTTLLDLEANQRVLDACAAPGGKSCAILEHEPQVKLTALDIDAGRSKRISENFERLKLDGEIKVGRAEFIDEWWDQEPFDRILVDAPCSATGVIRRHPDIKLLREEGDIVALASLQLKILSELWKTLASGGKLLYATCSVFPQENSRVVERFLNNEPDAKLLPISAEWGIDTGFGRQLFPNSQGHDGFFYACIGKAS